MGQVHQETEISEAAANAYGRLVRILDGAISTRPSRDGGLICELRRPHARPVLWRIRSDGSVAADRLYSFVRGGFVTAPLPQGV